MKCQDTPALHSSELWDSLRGMMYKSQARIARMESQAAFAPPPPVQPQPCATPAAPQQPAPAWPWQFPGMPLMMPGSPQQQMPMAASQQMMPYFMATTWMMPTTAAPTTTTLATTTVPTTTAKPCPTSMPVLPVATPEPKPQKPPIQVTVDINQKVENAATARSKSGLENVKKVDAIPPAGAPAAVAAGSPGLVVSYAPSPAGQMPPMMPPPPPMDTASGAGPPEVPGVPAELPSVPAEVPAVPEGVPEVPAEVPAVPEGVPEVSAPEVPGVR